MKFLPNKRVPAADEKKIAFNPAYELSFLKKEEQTQLLDAMDSEQATPSLSQASASARETRSDERSAYEGYFSP